MWVLECSGDDLKGKKLWLPPGKKFIFGRTKADDTCETVVVSHKTISRKHLRLEVGHPNTNDCQNPRTRSRITVEDYSTKIGTLLNGNQIRGLSVDLEEVDNTITLGRYEHCYRITWVPVTLTFSFTAQEHKANSYAWLYDKLGPLDIKVLINYEREFTTHVVSKKRNTAKSLLALIDGKYIVHSDIFINALVVATSPGNQGIIPLQTDFEGNFPDPNQYLPPKGDEPSQFDEVAYVPNELRRNVFNGYSFVFYEERQYENLLPPITAGGGRATLRVARPYESTVDEFVKYVKEMPYEKDSRELEDSDKTKKTVVVRFNPVKGSDTQWYADFGMQVAFQLDYRLAEQNEFLDAILANDASSLRRPLKIEAPTCSRAAHIPLTEDFVKDVPSSLQLASLSAMETVKPLSPPRRGRSYRAGRTKFTGFDDDFRAPCEPPISSVLDKEMMQVDLQSVAEFPQSQSLFLSQDPDRVAEEPETQIQDRVSQKRKAITSFDEEFEGGMELSPQNLTLKKRRLNEEEKNYDGQRIILPESPPIIDKNDSGDKGETLIPAPFKSASKKKIEDIDAEVRNMLSRKYDSEKTEANLKNNAEPESLEDQLDGLDIAEIRSKIQIIEIEVRESTRADRLRRAKSGNRWDENWNGRKNFKKFRRQGETRGHRGLDKVIVPLTEAKKRNYGMDEDCWRDDSLHNSLDGCRRKERQGIIKTEQPYHSKSTGRFIVPREAAQPSDPASYNAGEDITARRRSVSPDLDSTLSSSRGHSTLGRSQALTHSATESHISTIKGAKRVADSPISRSGPDKKAKLMVIKQTCGQSDDEDSQDELKFRFRKKR